jgi:hypothetical protein
MIFKIFSPQTLAIMSQNAARYLGTRNTRNIDVKENRQFFAGKSSTLKKSP